jgi:hypothetical protein
MLAGSEGIGGISFDDAAPPSASGLSRWCSSCSTAG